MPKSVTSYSLVISCPSDVLEYLGCIYDAIESFNHGFGTRNDIIIEARHWTKDTYSNMQKGQPAQEEINRQLLTDTDMLIGIFWTRFGSPTDKYGSGTEEEINIMLDNGKPVILYFLNKPVAPIDIDVEQLRKINAFKDKHKSDGLFRILNNEAELALKLRDELELRFTDILKKTSTPRLEMPERKSILWVDDQPENNTIGRKYFEQNGIEIIPVLSTEQATRYLKNNKVSVIISDMGRKEGSREGYVLLDKLRKSGDNTPFIIFAGSRSMEHIKETVRHGGQGCTNDFAELFRMVSSILLGTFYEQES